MSVGIRVRASYLLAPLLIAASLVGCGEEEEREFTVMVTTDQGALAGDGSEVAIVRATVLDQHDRPPSLGGEILLQVQGPGVVGRTGGASGYAFIDVTGAAGFDVACSDAGTLQLMAAYEGAFGFLPWHIECGTLPGDWQIFMDIESSRPVPGQVLAVTIDVVDGSGDPVPSGTRITLEVTSGDFLWGRSEA